jgi:hypothetical protein
VLKEIFVGLGPYFVQLGQIKRTTHDASPCGNQPISAKSSSGVFVAFPFSSPQNP